MTRSSSQTPSTAHQKAVNALANARQHVRKYRFSLERASVPEDQIFVTSDNPEHPQKNAHAALMDYFEEVNQAEYTRRFDDIWGSEITDAAGNPVTVEVPVSDTLEKVVTEDNVDNMVPDMKRIETEEETVKPETLGYKWAGRTVTVRAKVDSPYHSKSEKADTVRLWMPPRLIKAAYSTFNDALSKVNLLAQTSAPVEHDPDPI